MKILFLTYIILIATLFSEHQRQADVEEVIADVPEYLRPAFIEWTDDYVFYYDFETVTLFYQELDGSSSPIPDQHSQSYRFNRGQGPGEVQDLIGGISYHKNKDILMAAVPQNERMMLLSMPDFEHIGDIPVFDSAGIVLPHFSDEYIVYHALMPAHPETFFTVCNYEDDWSALKNCSTLNIELDFAESEPEYSIYVSKGGNVIYEDSYIYFAHSRVPVIRTFNIETGRQSDKIIYDESAMPEVVSSDQNEWLEGIADFNGLAKVDDRFFVLAVKNKRFPNTRDYWARNNDDRYLNNVIYEVASKDDDSYHLNEFMEFDQYVLEINQHNGYMYALLSDDSQYTVNARIVRISIND